ncbi:serine/threonine-protein kinase [Dactylosporangium sp. NPDC049525]|uniref:serine/threonine-protein kinase n=1 Tax=Dactylosporangium sp. NPDC049525 TaxID=3154730 RepID=UPI0034450044
MIEPIGEGGMSVVWRAYDEVLRRRVAVKLLSTRLPDAGRLRAEAQAAALLNHPNVTAVYDYGVAGDEPFVVMELLDGETLSARLTRGPLHWRAAVEVCAHTAAALSAAHARGLAHRDIKPGNIMLTDTGVKVVDFGIAALAGRPVDGPVVGTPGYLAPERLAGEIGGPAVDVYALGIVLFQSLTGRRPAGVDGLVRDDVELTVPLVPGMPPEVAALYQECLAVDPGARPSSATLASRLAALAGMGTGALDGGPPTSRTGTERTGTEDPRTAPPRRGPRVPRTVLGAALAAAVLAALALTFGTLRLPSTGLRAAPSCTVGYRVTEIWPDGATVALSITNTGRTDITRWALTFDLPDGVRARPGWNGTWRQQGTHVSVAATADNAYLAAGASVGDVGTNVDGKDAGTVPERFTLNGKPCRSGAPLS